MAFGVGIYRRTIISVEFLIIVVIVSSTAAFLLRRKNYKRTYNSSFSNFFCWLQCIMSWGFIACTMFLATNLYTTDQRTNEGIFEIIEISDMQGYRSHRNKRQPLVRINYQGNVKELIFQSAFLETIHDCKRVRLITSRGLLGFDIIELQELLE